MSDEPSAFEALPQIPIAKAVAAAAANGALVRAVDASDTLFVLVAHLDGRVDLNTRLEPDEMAAALRALAAVVEARGALDEDDAHAPFREDDFDAFREPSPEPDDD